MNMDTSFAPVPEEMRKRYLARRHQDATDCPSKIENQDWAYFERLGHQLKGNAPSYGFDDLQQIALKIELSARERDLLKLKSNIEEFQSWVERARS
jgi:HPt (histidine-containing phosphotransfer) domain-containing protein